MKLKKSSLGFIPAGWEVKTVRQLIDENVLFQPLDGNHGELHPKGSDFVSSGIPFIMASDLQNGIVDLFNCKFISKNQADNLRKGFAKTEDILLSHKATIGKVAFLKNIDTPYIMLTPQVTYYRVRDKNKLSARYLKFYFESHAFQSILKLWAGSGSTRDYIGITEQQKLPVLLPDIETQKRISIFLSDYDDLIEINNQRIKLLKETARELYKEWFVRLRFPGFKKTKFVKGIPKNWEYKSLASVSEYINRGLSPKYDESGYSIVLNQKCIRNNEIDFTYSRRQNKTIPKSKLLKKGDVLINSTGEGTLGRTAQLYENLNDITVDSHVTIARCKNDFSKEYYGLTILSLENYFELMALGSTGQTELGRRLIANVSILIPDKGTLDKFSEIIAPINDQIILISKQNSKLKQIRDKTLPKLISGRIEVKAEKNKNKKVLVY